MATLIAVDPSTSKTGAAVFIDRALWDATMVRRPRDFTQIPECWDAIAAEVWRWALGPSEDPEELAVALEYPKVYPDGRGKGDPNGLFPLACVAQSIVARARLRHAEIIHYLPRDWKGTREKDVNTVDVRARLAPAEFARIPIPGNTCEHCAAHFPKARCVKWPGPRSARKWEPCDVHNIYDAVGIGLKALGRFDRFRVLPR